MRRVAAFFIFFVSFSLVYISIAYYLVSPKAFQPFMAFGVFSESGSLSTYTGGFPLPVPENQTMTWSLEVVNKMGAVQFVRLQYRVGNSTTGTPNNTFPAPDSAPTVGKLEAFIAGGDTRRFEFTWAVLKKVQSGGTVYLDMVVNGTTISPPIGAVSGDNFRFMFELWTFDVDTNSFQYGWQQESSRVGSWLQVWFDAA